MLSALLAVLRPLVSPWRQSPGKHDWLGGARDRMPDAEGAREDRRFVAVFKFKTEDEPAMSSREREAFRGDMVAVQPGSHFAHRADQIGIAAKLNDVHVTGSQGAVVPPAYRREVK